MSTRGDTKIGELRYKTRNSGVTSCAFEVVFNQGGDNNSPPPPPEEDPSVHKNDAVFGSLPHAPPRPPSKPLPKQPRATRAGWSAPRSRQGDHGSNANDGANHSDPYVRIFAPDDANNPRAKHTSPREPKEAPAMPGAGEEGHRKVDGRVFGFDGCEMNDDSIKPEASPQHARKSEEFARASQERARVSRQRARAKAQAKQEELEREAAEKAKAKHDRHRSERVKAQRAKEASDREYEQWKDRHFGREQQRRQQQWRGARPESARGAGEKQQSRWGAHHNNNKQEHRQPYGGHGQHGERQQERTGGASADFREEFERKFGRGQWNSTINSRVHSSSSSRRQQLDAIKRELAGHEKSWLTLVGGSGVIKYNDVAWPEISKGPRRNNLLMKYLLRGEAADRAQLLKSLRMRWHPDKFQQAFGHRLCAQDSPKIFERINSIFSEYLSG